MTEVSFTLYGWSVTNHSCSEPPSLSSALPLLLSVVQPQHSSKDYAVLLGTLWRPGFLRRRGERQPGLTQAQDGKDSQGHAYTEKACTIIETILCFYIAMQLI